MKFRYLYSFLIVFLCLPFAHAQNLAFNGSLELGGCPSAVGQVPTANGWWIYNATTPDYFKTCASSSSLVSVPVNYFGYQNAASGNAYCGFVTYFPTGVNQEYVADTMAPMVVGCRYKVSMSVSLADECVYGGDGLGMWFFKNAIRHIPFYTGMVPATPQAKFLSAGIVSDKTNWVRITDTVLADSAYDHVVLGGFNDATTITKYNTGTGTTNQIYYYMDSVVITPIDKIKIALTDTAYCAGDTVKVNVKAHPGSFNAGNVFTLQLSDAAGNFTNPVNIASVTTKNDTTIKGLIPATTSPGIGYRLRIISGNPTDSSMPSRNIIWGNVGPAKPIASRNAVVCEADSLKLFASSASSGITYSWTGPAFFSRDQNPFITPVSLTNSGTYVVTAWLYGCGAKDTVTVNVVPTIGVIGNNSNAPICSYDTLKLFGSSAASGTIYHWSGPGNFVSGAKDTVIIHPAVTASGNYILTGSFSGCIAKDTIAVLVKPSDFTASASSSICQGSLLSLIGSANATGVSWSWTGPGGFSSGSQSPSITNAQPSHSGNYYLTASLNGCIVKDTVVINVIAIPATPVPTANTPVCFGQTLTLDAGIPAPAFSWTGPGSVTGTTRTLVLNNAGPGIGGTYTVRALDGSCFSSAATINVAVIPAPVVNMYPSPKDSICVGTTVTFNASSANAGAAPTYKWYKNSIAIPGAAGTSYNTNTTVDFDEYYCTVTSNGTCAVPYTTGSNTIQMRVFPWLPASVSITSTNPSVNGGELITFNATPVNGGTFPVYQWKRNNKDIVGALSNTWGAKNLDDKDVICVTMSSSYLCPQPKTASSNCITVSINTTGIDKDKLIKGVNIYPNPVTNQLIIEGIETGFSIILTDVLGRTIISSVATSSKQVISTASLLPGTYLLQLANTNSERINARIIKNS